MEEGGGGERDTEGGERGEGPDEDQELVGGRLKGRQKVGKEQEENGEERQRGKMERIGKEIVLCRNR